jgi:dTDP-glucose 4,6-dehydratase
MQTWLVTGGAGFIGSCFVRMALKSEQIRVVNLDKLTYAGDVENVPHPPVDRYAFRHGCIGDRDCVADLLRIYRPTAVINFAAETHVDRSIGDPDSFLQTNVVRTVSLLDESLAYYRRLTAEDRSAFRFLQISTDEVYGSLGETGAFSEDSPYRPNSPYAASKAAADMFVRAYRETYGLPTLLTHCSNNYGPYQFPEKLVPKMISNAVQKLPLPVYGDGSNVREWLYVEDHCRAIMQVVKSGVIGETYDIGGESERTNLQVVESICDLVDEFLQVAPARASRRLIQFVPDRPGHDRRYAIDSYKVRNHLQWEPLVPFHGGLRKTVQWYLENQDWVKRVSSSACEGTHVQGRPK